MLWCVRAALCGISQVPLCSAMSKAGVSQVAGAAVDTMAEAAPQAEAAPARISAKGKRGTSVDDSATPAKRARQVAAGSGSKKDARQKKEVPQEPVKPELPKNAFTLFGKVKWPVLVGTPQDRLEQAQLMWKVLPPNDRSACKVEAAELRAKHEQDCEQYKTDYEAWRKSLPPAARAELKFKEKEATEAAKAHAKEQAERARVYRARLKDMGDTLKGPCWDGSRGTLRFNSVGDDLFAFIFGRYAPARASESSPVISSQLDKSKAIAVFGVTKLRGGSMYAKFEVCAMSVNYRSREQVLELGYEMNDYF